MLWAYIFGIIVVACIVYAVGKLAEAICMALRDEEDLESDPTKEKKA